MSRCHALGVALFLVVLTISAHSSDTSDTDGAKSTDGAKASALPAGFGASLPLAFEPNQGQTNSEVRFLTRGPGYTVYLTRRETVLVLERLSAASPAAPPAVPFAATSAAPSVAPSVAPPVALQTGNGDRGAVPTRFGLRFEWQGGNPAPQFTAEAPLPGISNYFFGSDPANWHTHIPTFARVHLHEIYPGVDQVYYGNPGQLEYDLRVEPGAALGRIALHVSGADKIYLDTKGDLVIQAGNSEVRSLAPVVYQEEGGRRVARNGHYAVRDGNTVGFLVEDYDPAKPLVIDPVLRYSTYLGGSSAGNDPPVGPFSGGAAIAVDSFGFAYITGETTTVDFPTTSGVFENSCPSAPQLCTSRFATFVTKLSRGGTQLVYSTYLTGGFGTGTGLFNMNSGKLIAVDQVGNAHVTGTAFDDFPTTITALQQSCAFEVDSACAFYTKLNFDGSQLLYSTYYGTQDRLGLRNTTGNGLALDNQGNAYLTGFTRATDLITTAGAFQRTFGGGETDAYVAKFNSGLSGDASLVYGTYLGRSGDDRAFDIAVDSSGNAYVVGNTSTNQFPHSHGFGTGTGGAFLVKLSPEGHSLLYSTMLHGAVGSSIAIDGARNAYITGATSAPGFPTTSGAVQRTFGGGASDAFITKFNSSASALIYSSFFGGNGADVANGIAIDAAAHAFITGKTTSTNLRVTPGALQSTRHGPSDAFLAEFFVSGKALVMSTYFGGSGDESGDDVAVDLAGSAYITGSTNSADLKVSSNAFQKTLKGSSSGFIAKISPAADLALTKTASVTHATIGQKFTFTLHVLNKGPESTTNVMLFDPLPEGVVFVSASAHGCDSLTTPAAGTRGGVTCKRGFLDRNSVIDVVLTVRVQPPVGVSVLNQAAVSGDSFDPNLGNNTASVSVGVP